MALNIRAYALIKRAIRRLVARLDDNEIEGEFSELALMDDASFDLARAKHLARRQLPYWQGRYQNEDLGVALLVASIGAPGSLVFGLFTGETGYFVGAAFWSLVAVPIYAYMAYAAKYWRERTAISNEEVRRYGRTSFF